MDNRFLDNNFHWLVSQVFLTKDPHLSKLKDHQYVYKPPLLQNLPNYSGIFTLTGGCLTGKTTLMKQWMAKLIEKNIPARNIIFFPGALIENYHILKKLLEEQLSNPQSDVMHYIFLDDVTDINQWEKAIKFAADAGWLEKTMLILASCDKEISKTLYTHFPETKETHLHLSPLTFQQCFSLKYSDVAIENVNLYDAFNEYLIHGGFLSAINDFAANGIISDNTLKMYSDRLRAEIEMHGKKKTFLREILAAIIQHYSSPVTWNMLSQELSINHPKTIGAYLALLESLDAVFVQYALVEETFKPAPKKARKLIFCDPFIFHAINAWLHPGKNHFAKQIKVVLAEKRLSTKIVEACVTSHFRLYHPTYYIKGEGQIDVAYICDQRIWPIVVSWSSELRSKDLKQVLKYLNGKILTRALRSGIIEHIRTEPVSRALLKLGALKQLE